MTWLEKLVQLAKAGGLIALSLVVVYGVSIAIVSIPTSGDLQVEVKWPDRISTSVPGTLLVTVGEHNDLHRVPVAGADVRLFEISRANAPQYPSNDRVARLIVDGQMAQLSQTTTDAQGVALLEIPTRGRRTEFVVVVNSEIYRYEAFDPPTGGRVLLSTDRPLYQPGQRVKVRALVTDPDTGKPLARNVRWELRDPQGNLVARREGSSSDAGVASTEFPLAAQCRQGQWRVQIAVPAGLPQGATAPSQPAAVETVPETVVTEIIDVRPFRLPRFKVTVELDNDEVAGGQTLAGKVRAMTTYGEPVEGAEVEATLTWSRVGAPAAPVGFKGKTAADGTLPIRWDVPASVAPGSGVAISAIVTSAAGRAERGTTSASIPGGDLRVELISENGWLNGVEATGFVILTKPGGEPLVGARINLALPEKSEERTLTLTSDEHGQAEFRWSARSARVRVKVTPEGEASVTRDINVGVTYGNWWLHTDTMRVETDKPFKYEVRAANRVQDSVVTVLALRDGYPVAHASGVTGSMTLGVESSGLVTLVAYGSVGNELCRTSVWVSGPADALTMTLDSPEYRPGSTAKLGMAFSGAQSPVTYSLVGVDEALYALKERTNLPLTLLLHESPSRIAGVARALAPLSKQGNATTARISAARARQSLASLSSSNTRYGRDLTVSIGRARMRPYANLWVVLLGLLMLGLGAVAARLTWRAFEKRSFSWPRLFSMLGVSLAALLAPVIVIGLFDGEFTAGALAMWGVLVLCWVVAAAWRTDMKFGTFLWTLVGIGIVSGAVAVTSEGKPDDWALTAATVGGLVPVGLLGIELVLWSFALFQRFERRAALGLTTLAATALGMTLASLLTMSAGDSFSPHKAVQTMAPSPVSTGGFAMEMEEDSASDDSAKKEGRAKRNAPGAPPPVAAAPGAPRVRSWFPETMVWLPEVAADPDGSKELTLEIPDSITTWRLDATAHARDGRAGQARAGMRVVKPFFVELDAPTDLTVGDTAVIPVTLVNRGKAALTVTLGAKPRDGVHGGPDGTIPTDFNSPNQIASTTPRTVTVALEPGARVLHTVSIQAFKAGEANLTVSATVEGEDGDAVRRTIRVRAQGRAIRTSAAGFVGDGFTRQAPQTYQGGGHTRVSLFAGIGPQALDGLDGILRGPTGCFEQTSSATFPNVVVSQLLTQTAPDKWPGGAEKWAEARAQADEYLLLGYQRMLSFQAGDGGFALYQDRKSDTLLTAYGLMQLTEMDAVTTVDQSVIERAAFYLVQRQSVRGNWPVFAGRVAGGKYGNDGDPAQLRATAFIVWALAASKEADKHRGVIDKALDWLEKNTDETAAADTLGWVANALIAGERTDAAKKLVTRIAAKVARNGDQAWWPSSAPTWIGGWGVYADIESTALAVYAMLRTQSQGELLQPALRWLAARRSPRGGWGTTQATVWGLRVFRELGAKGDGGPATLGISAGGKPMFLTGEGEVSEVTVDTGDQVVRRFHAAGVSQVAVTSDTKNSVLAQADWTYAVPWNSEAAKVDGERLEVRTTHAPAAGRAERFTLVTQVFNRSRDLYGATIVELPVPPGAYVAQEDFESLQEGGAIDRFEVLPTHVRLYLSGFEPSSRRVFEYTVVPLVRGSFSLPPARAYLFYAPDPIAESDAGHVVVR